DAFVAVTTPSPPPAPFVVVTVLEPPVPPLVAPGPLVGPAPFVDAALVVVPPAPVVEPSSPPPPLVVVFAFRWPVATTSPSAPVIALHASSAKQLPTREERTKEPRNIARLQ